MTDHQQDLHDTLLRFPRAEAARKVQKRSPVEFVLECGWWYEPCEVPEGIAARIRSVSNNVGKTMRWLRS